MGLANNIPAGAEIETEGDKLTDDALDDSIVSQLRGAREEAEGDDPPKPPDPLKPPLGDKKDDPPKKEPDPTPPEVKEPDKADVSDALRDKIEARNQARREASESKRKFEARLAELEADGKKKEEELTALRAQTSQSAEDPVAYYKALGYAPIEIAKLLAASELPDKATAETKLIHRQMLSDHRNKSEVQNLLEKIEGLEKKIDEKDQTQQASAYAGQIRAELTEGLQNLPAAATLVAKQAEQRPEKAIEHMLQIVARYTEAHPSEPLPTFDDVVDEYERYLADFQCHGTPAAPEPDTKRQPKPTKGAPTLSPADLAGRASAEEDLPEDNYEADEELARRLRARRRQAAD